MTRKIAVLGITGSGKSTVSRKLAEKTGLPLYHMDALFWKPAWTEVPEAEYLAGQKELLEKDRWIIEGWIDNKLAQRAQSADLVVYLDYPRWLCAWRYIRRILIHRKKARPELPEGCYDRFRWRQLRVVLSRAERCDIETVLESISNKSKIVRITSPEALELYLDTL